MESRQGFIDEVKGLFNEADDAQIGEITFAKFEFWLQDVRVQSVLKNLGIDVFATEAKSLFDLFDVDGSGTIDISELAFGLQRYRGAARGVDLAQLQNGQKRMNKKISRVLDLYEEREQTRLKGFAGADLHEWEQTRLKGLAYRTSTNSKSLKNMFAAPTSNESHSGSTSKVESPTTSQFVVEELSESHLSL